MDGQVRELLEEAGTWPALRLDEAGVRLDRVNQLRECEWSQPYEEVALTAEHVADVGEVPVRVKEYVGAGLTATESAPALLRLHAGGMVLGSPELEDRGSRALANALRCRVFAPAYRLAPESRHPAALEDCRTALRWLLGNAEPLGVDAARVAIVGHSAGGMLALGCALSGAAADGPSRVVAIEPMVGPGLETDSLSRFAAGYGLTREELDRFWSLYLPEDGAELDPADAPWLADDVELSRLAPVDVFTSELDPLRDEGEQLVERLHAAGVAVTHRRFAGLIHGSISYCGRVEAARQAFDAVVEVIARGWRS